MNSRAALKAGLIILGIVELVLLAACGGPTLTTTLATVTPPSSSTQTLFIEPSSAAIRTNTTLRFSSNANVTWSIREGSAGGTISSDGLYTAPNVGGTYHIIATATADPNLTATATVSVVELGSSQTVGNLGTARFDHEATLLADGDVLITGGGAGSDSDHFEVTADAELFDSVHLTFTVVGQVTRVFHTATLLRTGQVLLVGGSTDGFGTDVSTAELYDPLTRQFQPTGSMASEREFHAATLLGDGRVLIAGGRLFSGLDTEILRTAEIYDPVAGTFSPTGSMNQARSGASATLLADGKVLILGGYDNRGPLFSAELYNPATGSFVATGSMINKHAGPAATLLANGKVLITGGDYAFTSPAAELYDPATGLFTLTGVMTTPRWTHTATRLSSGKVLVVGGWGFTAGAATAEVLASVELYDPASGQFASTANLQTARAGHTATLLSDGGVLIVGGNDSSSFSFHPLNSAEIYK